MSIKKEIWKDIKNYEGLYQVSNLGRVRSLNKCVKHSNHYMNLKGQILKLQIDCQTSYKKIRLCKDGKYKQYSIHRLVAEAFIPNPNNYPVVNHINENRIDNRVENLEWCTVSYNNTYGDRIKRVVSKTSKPILQYDLKGNFIKEFPSLSEAARTLKMSASNIVSCCTGKYKQAKGYIWKYKSEVMPNL